MAMGKGAVDVSTKVVIGVGEGVATYEADKRNILYGRKCQLLFFVFLFLILSNISGLEDGMGFNQKNSNGRI